MYELMVMRHAKSDWNNQRSDFDRPLNDRGVRDAKRMGSYLLDNDLVPECMLVSAANRTRQTAHLLSKSFTVNEQDVFIDDALYLASIGTLLESIKNHIEDNKRLMIVAHNPGVDDVVDYLSNEPVALSSSGKLMVTCAIAVFTFHSIDDMKQSGQAKLTRLLRPGEI